MPFLFAENPLPAEYVAAPFIESDGTQYLDTGVCPDWTTSVAIDCALFNVSSTEKPRLFGTDMNGGGTIGFAVYVNGSGNWASSARDGDGDYTKTSVGADEERHLHELDAATGVYARDGVTRTTSRSGTCVNSCAYTMYVFGSHRTAGLGSAAKMRLYGMRIEQGGELVRDYVPCFSLADGALGVYDRVTDTFNSGRGAGRFTCADAGSVFVTSDDSLASLSPRFARLVGFRPLRPGGEMRFEAPAEIVVRSAEGPYYQLVLDGWTLDVVSAEGDAVHTQGGTADCAFVPADGDAVVLSWRWRRHLVRTSTGCRMSVPWVESDGTQYVDTGICPDWTTSVAVDCALFNPSSTEKPRLFGTDMNGGSTIGFAVYVNGNGNWASSARDGVGDYTATTVKADAERHLHELDAATSAYALDGVTRTTSRIGTCVNSSSLSMYVFGSHRTAGLGSAAKMRLYGMRIEQGGELVRDLRPCVETDSDGRGRAGLYDAANDVFHPASGGELAMLADAVVPGVVAQVSSDAAELADVPGFAPLTGLAVLAPGTETVLRAPRGKSVSKADGEAYKVDGWRLTVRRNGLPDAVSQGRGTVCALTPVLGDELELVWRWKRVRPGTMIQIR